jgi:hypothetical protein
VKKLGIWMTSKRGLGREDIHPLGMDNLKFALG